MFSNSKTNRNFVLRKRKRSEGKNNSFKKEDGNKKRYSLRYRNDVKIQKCTKDIYTPSSKISSHLNYCKTVNATDKDFLNPIMFLESLWNENKTSTGVIKIIPPSRWRESNNYIFDNFYFPNFINSDKKLVSRIQILNQLFKAKKFKFVKDLSLKEYKDFSKESQCKLYPKQDVTLDEIEEDFWKFCYSKENYETLYAADVSYSTFLSKNDLNKISEHLQKENTWNLTTIHSVKDSLLQFLTDEPSLHISGLTMPWVYFGMLFSTFCWHVEDLYMYSINYMYYGKPKIWYCISHDEKEKLDKFIKEKKLDVNVDDPNVLHKLILLIDPAKLINYGINIYKAVQNPGEIIFTLPKAYHAGFSCGFNIAEAVNVATSKWIDYGIKACEDYSKSRSKMPVFPMEWLIHKNVQNIEKFKFNEKLEKEKLITLFLKMVKSEKIKRRNLENYLTKNKIAYEKFTISEKEHYSKSECDDCTKYGYFSYQKCYICNSKKCLEHLEICDCSLSCVMIFYRRLD